MRRRIVGCVTCVAAYPFMIVSAWFVSRRTFSCDNLGNVFLLVLIHILFIPNNSWSLFRHWGKLMIVPSPSSSPSVSACFNLYNLIYTIWCNKLSLLVPSGRLCLYALPSIRLTRAPKSVSASVTLSLCVSTSVKYLRVSVRLSVLPLLQFSPEVAIHQRVATSPRLANFSAILLGTYEPSLA